jgi:hypothetical protein
METLFLSFIIFSFLNGMGFGMVLFLIILRMLNKKQNVKQESKT